MVQDNFSQNFLFPVFLKLEELRVLLVGAGPVGCEKAAAILKNSPHTRLKVIAELVSDEMYALQRQYPHLLIEERRFKEGDLQNIDLLFLAINNKPLSADIRDKARQKNILVNVADTPDLCDYYLSSVVQKGNLKLAISTNGKSPTVAKRLREVLEEALPDELNDLLQNMHRLRETLRGNFAEKVKRLNDLTASLKNINDSST